MHAKYEVIPPIKCCIYLNIYWLINKVIQWIVSMQLYILWFTIWLKLFSRWCMPSYLQPDQKLSHHMEYGWEMLKISVLFSLHQHRCLPSSIWIDIGAWFMFVARDLFNELRIIRHLHKAELTDCHKGCSVRNTIVN